MSRTDNFNKQDIKALPSRHIKEDDKLEKYINKELSSDDQDKLSDKQLKKKTLGEKKKL